MAKEEEPKKPGEGDQNPNQMILEKSQDPDQAVIAEQAIMHYVHWVLEQLTPALEASIEGFGSWLSSQTDAKAFDNQGFFADLTRAFMEQMGNLMGGAQSPIAQHLAPMLSDPLDEAQREHSVQIFVNEMRRSARDACWYLRDNAQSILSNQWDQLRDLAYEGSTEFIPLLHQLGLPSADFKGNEVTQNLIAEAEKFRATVPKEKEEAEQKNDQAAKEGDEASKQSDQADKDKLAFQEEEAKKQAV